jgi:hypothetical protein
VIAAALSVALVLLAAAGDLPQPPAPPDVAPLPAASSAPARATASFVAVMQPPPSDPLLGEVASRIRSELAASSVPSQLVDCAAAAETHAPCPSDDADATIALGRDDGVVELDVRAILPDGLELSRHVRVLDRDGGQDPSVLAVRAVELLRDLRLNAQRRAPTGSPKPATDAEEPKIPLPPRPPPLWRLSMGVAVLAAPRTAEPGFSPALGAALRGSAILNPHLVTVLTIAGPFNSTLSTSADGQAALIQAVATLEVRYRFFPGVVQPFVAVLTGVNYLRETLTSMQQMLGNAPPLSAAWVPLFGAGGGVTYELMDHLSVGAEAEIFATTPNMLVEVDNGTVVARTGAPSILVTTDLSVAFP